MPAVMALFIALSALIHTDTLLRGTSAVWKGVDHQEKMTRTGPTPVAYILTTTPWFERKADRNGGCNFQILARVQGGGQTRFVLGGREMLVDDNWAARSRIDGGETVTIDGYFLDPIGGATIAYRTTRFRCRASDIGSSGFVQPDMSMVR